MVGEERACLCGRRADDEVGAVAAGRGAGAEAEAKAEAERESARGAAVRAQPGRGGGGAAARGRRGSTRPTCKPWRWGSSCVGVCACLAYRIRFGLESARAAAAAGAAGVGEVSAVSPRAWR